MSDKLLLWLKKIRTYHIKTAVSDQLFKLSSILKMNVKLLQVDLFLPDT